MINDHYVVIKSGDNISDRKKSFCRHSVSRFVFWAFPLNILIARFSNSLVIALAEQFVLIIRLLREAEVIL
ncbi:hypothetical protein LINPERHAP2_LOCUS7064 [Linum perenne]